MATPSFVRSAPAPVNSPASSQEFQRHSLHHPGRKTVSLTAAVGIAVSLTGVQILDDSALE